MTSRLTISCRSRLWIQSVITGLFELSLRRPVKLRTKTLVSRTTRVRCFRATIGSLLCLLAAILTDHCLDVVSQMESRPMCGTLRSGQQLLIRDSLNGLAEHDPCKGFRFPSPATSDPSELIPKGLGNLSANHHLCHACLPLYPGWYLRTVRNNKPINCPS